MTDQETVFRTYISGFEPLAQEMLERGLVIFDGQIPPNHEQSAIHSSIAISLRRIADFLYEVKAEDEARKSGAHDR